MKLQNFPLDQQVTNKEKICFQLPKLVSYEKTNFAFFVVVQNCPLWIGSYSYSTKHIEYRWKSKPGVADWKPIQIDRGVKLSQFDLLNATWNGTQYQTKSK